jgi:hypothetical protein
MIGSHMNLSGLLTKMSVTAATSGHINCVFIPMATSTAHGTDAGIGPAPLATSNSRSEVKKHHLVKSDAKSEAKITRAFQSVGRYKYMYMRVRVS